MFPSHFTYFLNTGDLKRRYSDCLCCGFGCSMVSISYLNSSATFLLTGVSWFVCTRVGMSLVPNALYGL